MLNFITLPHGSRPRYCVHKGVSGSAGRPRRPRRLPPACGPPGQEGKLFRIAAAAGSGSPATASAPPRRARGPGRQQDEGQGGEVVAERLVHRSAPAGELFSAGERFFPAAGSPLSDAPGDTGGCVWGKAEAALGTNRGQVTWREQRSPCKKTDAERGRGRGRWCSRLERGRLRAAWGAAAERGGGQWVSASGKLCRTAGGLCRRLPGVWEPLASVHSCQERAGGHRRVALEMPGGSGQGTGTLVTLQTVDLEWFLTAAF